MDRMNSNMFASNAVGAASVISTLVYILVATVLFGVLLFIAFRIVSYSRRDRSRPVATTALYEPFATETGYVSEIGKRLASIRELKQKMSGAFESVSQITDDTCRILQDVEQGYVADRAAPSDAAEYELPQTIQKQRIDERKVRAKKMFLGAQAFYAKSKGKPIYSCEGFANQSESKEQELQTELRELIDLMDSAELRTVELDTMLGFTQKYLTDALSHVTAEAFDGGGQADKLLELTGGDLLAKADYYIGKGLTLFDRIAALSATLSKQQEMSRQLTANASRLERGDIRETDIAAGLAAL